ncbi:MAG: chemotaxis protein CheC [Bdellovibrionota bacterium]
MEHLKQNLFPNQFDFFHLGRIESIRTKWQLKKPPYSPFIVLFRFSGDELGYGLVAFDRTPANIDEESMALEIANILTSKFATQLADAANGSVQISPPEVVRENDQKHRYLMGLLNSSSGTEIAQKNYRFVQKNQTLRLAMVYLPSQTGQT